MTRFPEPGRLAGHVLLDSVVASDPEGDEDANAAAANLAFARLTEIDGAYGVVVDDSGEDINVQLDLSNILGASLVTIDWLSKRLAEARGLSVESVISEARAYLDE